MVIRNVTITMTMTVFIVLIVDVRQGEGEGEGKGSQNKIGQIWSQRTNTRGEGVWENP